MLFGRGSALRNTKRKAPQNEENSMFKFKLFASAFALASAIFLIPATAAAPANNPSASGHGNVTINGSLRTFSFNAVRHQDGSVTGQSEVNNRDLTVRSHMEIDCMVITGNIATISGIITNSSDSNFNGLPALFRVEDNGEGKNSPPDRISLVFFGPVPACTAAINVPLIPIDGGNIQVKP